MFCRHSLALSVLQVEMRVEVDKYPLVGTRRRDDPHAPLRGRVGHRVSGRREVAGAGDSDVASAFICRGERKA